MFIFAQIPQRSLHLGDQERHVLHVRGVQAEERHQLGLLRPGIRRLLHMYVGGCKSRAQWGNLPPLSIRSHRHVRQHLRPELHLLRFEQPDGWQLLGQGLQMREQHLPGENGKRFPTGEECVDPVANIGLAQFWLADHEAILRQNGCCVKS